MEKKSMGNNAERTYASARYAIAFLIVLTAVNILLRAVNIDRYFVSSVFLSYYMVTVIPNTALGILTAVAILVPYVLAFLLSKKRPVWMIVALVLFAIDTGFVIYIMIALYRVGESPLSMIFDLLLHALGLFELGMGVKYRAAATAEASPEAVSEDGMPMPSEGDGPYTEINCVVTVPKENGTPAASAMGVVRFYENEVVIGTVGTAKTLLVGSAFSTPTERMRFGYAEIAQASYANKNERVIRIDLSDGRSVVLNLNDRMRDELATELYRRGVVIAPFAG